MKGRFVIVVPKILGWELFTDVNACHLFLYCLVQANWKNQTWKGQEYERGSFPSSIKKMSVDTGLSEHQVRTALEKLTKEGCVATIVTPWKGTKIKVVHYDKYQRYGNGSDNENDTVNGNGGDNSYTIYTNYTNKEKKDFPVPTKKEVEEYAEHYGVIANIDGFMDYNSMKGWSCKDWKAAYRSWSKKERNRPKASAPVVDDGGWQ